MEPCDCVVGKKREMLLLTSLASLTDNHDANHSTHHSIAY